MSRVDHAKQFRVKIMGAGESFSFNGRDFEQVVVINTGTPDVYLRDVDSNDFPLTEGVSFNLSTIPSKALNGLTIVTQAGGSASIAYVQ